MVDQGIWHHTIVNGKQVWHFYPTHVPGAYPAEPKDQWELANTIAAAEETKTVVLKNSEEAPPPANKNIVAVHGNTVPLHAPGSSVDQTLVPANQNVASDHKNCTHNYYNTYNYIGTAEKAAIAEATGASAAAAKAEEEKSKAEAEAITITEDEFKMDAMLHEQAQALRQLHYLHTVDYGVGDVYGRRYTRK